MKERACFQRSVLASGVSGAISAFRRISGRSGAGRVALVEQDTGDDAARVSNTPATAIQIHGRRCRARS